MTQRFFFLLKRLKSLPWISGHFRIIKSVTIRIAMQLALIYFKCFLRHSFFLCCLDWPQSSQFISIHQHSGCRSCTFSFHFFPSSLFHVAFSQGYMYVAKATCVWPRLQTLNFLASFPVPQVQGLLMCAITPDMWCLELNPGLHLCEASTLTAGLHAQSF